MPKRVYFLFFDGCEGLSFAGPDQAFHEANQLGADYEIHHCGLVPSVVTEQKLTITDLEPLPVVTTGDLVFVSGYTIGKVEPPAELIRWVKRAWERRPTLVSVCSGAFVLGHAGVLDGRSCTTHWKRVELLRQTFPRAHVVEERLFVQDGLVYTSGGGASVVELALHLIEADHGPLMAARVAHEMVIYIRRDSTSRQTSVFLDYRSHLNPAIHTLQDLVGSNPGDDRTLGEWAQTVGMSPRSLTRTFRQATGISFHEYRTRLRLERATSLLNSPDLTVDAVASRCGFSDARQLRRLWRQAFGTSPKAREGTSGQSTPLDSRSLLAIVRGAKVNGSNIDP